MVAVEPVERFHLCAANAIPLSSNTRSSAVLGPDEPWLSA